MSVKIAGSILIVLVATLVVCLGQETRQNPQATNSSSSSTSKPAGETKPNANQSQAACGTISDLALKVEICAKPLMDIIEGRMEKKIVTEADVAELCNKFQGSEKCIRDVGRKCAKGLQKTILSTLANSIQRARKRECIKPKYDLIIKTTQCVDKHQIAVQKLVSNINNKLDVIENQMPDPDQKTNAVCCMVHEIEREIKALLNPRCPTELQMILRLYRALLEDILELICRSPKCNDIFKSYKIPKNAGHSGIVSYLLRIVFSLG